MKHLLICVLGVLPATAWQSEVNVPNSGALEKISPTRLSYTLSWDGKLKAGTLEIVFGKKDPNYPHHFLAQGFGGSTGWAHALFPFKFNYISFLNKKTLRPILFVGSEKQKSRTTKQQYRFTSQKVTGTESKTRNGKTKTSENAFHYPNSLDLFSGLLQIRSMPLKNGDQVVMPFHPVATPYLAKIRVLGREKHLGRDCIKLKVAMEKIGPDLTLQEYKKLKSATLWLSDDQWRVPVEVRAKVYVGSVRMILTRHEKL